ncbi:MAG: hypothetical protein J0L84_02755 [Verrucomicrobia bacterium]|nr:hypothetical protein [Verrucomicrobiota bacterium]
MTFLPLAERELRVAARQPITRRLRLGAALAALVIAAGFYLLLSVGLPGASRAGFGTALFTTLIAIAFGAALLAGPFLTSDCLSEEKREGTLGFLFLTDLRGHDVVLGKLASTSVRAGFALLALLPVVATALLLGGVTGLQFWKSALTLISTLAVSLSAGMLASALSRQPQKALALTLLFLALLTGVTPLLDELLGGTGSPGPVFFRMLSPVSLLMSAQGWSRGSFWLGWLVQWGIAASCLGVSSLVLPHVWQDRARSTAPRRRSLTAGTTSTGGFGGRRHRWRSRMLDENPAIWLAVRERWMLWMTWAMAGVLGALTLGVGLWAFWFEPASPGAAALASGSLMIWSWISGLLIWVLFIGAATQSARFFVDARRSGLLELLLATPLSDRAIVSGHWHGWWRFYGLPLALCLAMSAASTWAMQRQVFQQFSAAIPTAVPVTGGATNAAGLASTNGTTFQVLQTPGGGTVMTGVLRPPGSPLLTTVGPMALAVLHVGNIALNLIAVGWVGMWMGLTSRGVIVAAMKTLVFVQVIPWFVIAFASAISMPLILFPLLMNPGAAGPGAVAQQWMVWMPMFMALISAGLSAVKDLAFISWARRRLAAEFRLRALPTLSAVPIPPPPPGAAPPVISQ